MSVSYCVIGPVHAARRITARVSDDHAHIIQPWVPSAPPSPVLFTLVHGRTEHVHLFQFSTRASHFGAVGVRVSMYYQHKQHVLG